MKHVFNFLIGLQVIRILSGIIYLVTLMDGALVIWIIGVALFVCLCILIGKLITDGPGKRRNL